ncbi:hypothetical protein GJ744_001448 [Endocarpon pusillum]|uniref:Agmatinase 2 n=1 Tax=Endocarpon pusillum TaxID=364733 RepID=A0A8H7ANS1_9EURO|nr:hypothetical protein GJ744_001448 [Endocarpon pusillum]
MYLPLPVLHLAAFILQVSAKSFYDNPEQDPLPPSHESTLEELHKKWDFEWAFTGISTFAHLKNVKCLTSPHQPFDIGIIGCPFDTAVSYRPGARFGPRAIRAASSRQTSFRGFNHRAALNPYTTPFTILDCGDIPVTPFDNTLALRQMSEAYLELGSRTTAINPRPKPQPQPSSTSFSFSAITQQPWSRPKLLTLGGDHSLSLPALRALSKLYGSPISILHFDAHLDTWHPSKYPSSWSPPNSNPQGDLSDPASFNHGSMFHLASLEGLIDNSTSVHGGLRTRLSGSDFSDYADDDQAGFLRIHSDDIDDLGINRIVEMIMQRIGTEKPVYLSVDIDVLDPGLAPGTGTPEPGGWTSRELIRILRGVEGLNVVGADVVEVAPMYDAGGGEATALAAAQVVFEILTSMVKRGIGEMELGRESGSGSGGTRGEEQGTKRDEL